MAHIQFTDTLVREYLISRGFGTALKSFDADVKASKDHSFRVDKIMDILMSSINNLDLQQLRSMWCHLEQHIFCHLEAHQIIAARDLGIALMRRYVVQAASVPEQPSAAGHRNREKLNEFFDKMAAEIHSRPEWRDWFALPFLKAPEDHPSFSVFFSRQWQDTLTVSLHNFLAIVFQCMPRPTLAQYQEDSALMLQLQRETMDLRCRLEALTGGSPSPAPPELPPSQPIMDDFSVVAHEAPSVDSSSSSKLRSLLARSIGSTSPGSRRRSPVPRHSAGGAAAGSVAAAGTASRQESAAAAARQEPVAPPRLVRPAASSRRQVAAAAAVSESAVADLPSSDGSSGPVLLGQEALAGHRAAITQCRFNTAGSLLATCDMDGAVRVWEPAPPPARQVCLMRCRSPVLSCCWLNGQLLAYGSSAGEVRLHDVAKRRQLLELTGDALPALRDRRVLHLTAASPSTSLLCSVTSRASSGPPRSDLLIYDLKASRQECSLSLPAGVTCGSAEFNHNGQLLLCACSDGHVRVYDGRMEGCISDWTAHTGAALTVHLSSDQTHIYTLGADNKLVTWSLAQTGSHLAESTLHERATGPFLVSRPGGGEQTPQRPYGQLFALDGRQHLLTCGTTGGRLYQMGATGLELLLSLGGHVTSVLTCDISDNMCVTASLDGVVKTSSLLIPS